MGDPGYRRAGHESRPIKTGDSGKRDMEKVERVAVVLLLVLLVVQQGREVGKHSLIYYIVSLVYTAWRARALHRLAVQRTS